VNPFGAPREREWGLVDDFEPTKVDADHRFGIRRTGDCASFSYDFVFISVRT